MTELPGSESSSESFNGAVGYGRWVSFTGNYNAKASGQALATGIMVRPCPVTADYPCQPSVYLYGGTGYSVTPGQ